MEIGNLSQNQIITTFGPGAIIDAKEDSVMGLDINYWNNDGEEYRRIYFNKLASYLGGVRYFFRTKTREKLLSCYYISRLAYML